MPVRRSSLLCYTTHGRVFKHSIAGGGLYSCLIIGHNCIMTVTVKGLDPLILQNSALESSTSSRRVVSLHERGWESRELRVENWPERAPLSVVGGCNSAAWWRLLFHPVLLRLDARVLVHLQVPDAFGLGLGFKMKTEAMGSPSPTVVSGAR